MRMQLCIVVWAGLVAVTASSERLNADLVTFEFSGTVTSISQFSLDLFPGAVVGDNVTGTFGYSTNSLDYDEVNVDTTGSEYVDESPLDVFHWTFQLAGVDRSVTDVPELDTSISQLTISDDPVVDGFGFDVRASSGPDSTRMAVTLIDTTVAAFSNELPPADLDLSQFDVQAGSYSFTVPSGFTTIGFSFDSISQVSSVPEPGSVGMLATLLVGLSFVRRRSRGGSTGVRKPNASNG